MIKPHLMRLPHPMGGLEYLIMDGDSVYGKVAPYRPQSGAKDRRWWKASIRGVELGLFSGKNGRLVAIRAVVHFWQERK